MADTKLTGTLETPRIAVEHLASADGGQRLSDGSLSQYAGEADTAAMISGAASLLMIAELLDEMLKELRQLRGILCTRRPPL